MNSDSKSTLGNILFKTTKPGWKRSVIVSILLALIFGSGFISMSIFVLPEMIQSFSTGFLHALYFIVLVLFSVFLLFLFLVFISSIISRFFSHVDVCEKGIVVRNIYPLYFSQLRIPYKDILDVKIMEDEEAKEMLAVSIQTIIIYRTNEKSVKIDQDDASIEELHQIKEKVLRKIEEIRK